MNKIFLMGRLTKAPESTTSTSGTVCSRFSLAVDRKFKREGEPDADFFNCVSFGKQGEFVEKYLGKGSKVIVIGHVQNDKYTNSKGEEVKTTKVYTDEIEFAESKKAESKPESAGTDDGFLKVDSEVELPFS